MNKTTQSLKMSNKGLYNTNKKTLCYLLCKITTLEWSHAGRKKS